MFDDFVVLTDGHSRPARVRARAKSNQSKLRVDMLDAVGESGVHGDFSDELVEVHLV